MGIKKFRLGFVLVFGILKYIFKVDNVDVSLTKLV